MIQPYIVLLRHCTVPHFDRKRLTDTSGYTRRSTLEGHTSSSLLDRSCRLFAICSFCNTARWHRNSQLRLWTCKFPGCNRLCILPRLPRHSRSLRLVRPVRSRSFALRVTAVDLACRLDRANGPCAPQDAPVSKLTISTPDETDLRRTPWCMQNRLRKRIQMRRDWGRRCVPFHAPWSWPGRLGRSCGLRLRQRSSSRKTRLSSPFRWLDFRRYHVATKQRVKTVS